MTLALKRFEEGANLVGLHQLRFGFFIDLGGFEQLLGGTGRHA